MGVTIVTIPVLSSPAPSPGLGMGETPTQALAAGSGMSGQPVNSGAQVAGGWPRSGVGALKALGQQPHPMERDAAEGELEWGPKKRTLVF